MRKVLVTGASGFIGSHLMKHASENLRFRCLVRAPSLKKITPSPFIEIIEGDLLSEEALKLAMQGVDTVLHMGALIRLSRPEEIYRVNVEGTRRIVAEATKQKIPRFIFISTENALREDLSDAYADSKREAEAVVRTFKHSLILRPCFVFGSGDGHGLGRLVDLFGRLPVVPLFGGLESKIQPLYIEDMLQYLLKAIEKNLQGEYILAGPETVSMNDFLKEACRLRGKKAPYFEFPRFLYALLARICDHLPRSIGWGTSQFDNIYKSRTYSIEKTVRDFDYTPRPLHEGLMSWLSADKSL